MKRKKYMFCGIALAIAIVLLFVFVLGKSKNNVDSNKSEKKNEEVLSGSDSGINKNGENVQNDTALEINEEDERDNNSEKGYDLYVSEEEKEEAKKDCKAILENIIDIYKKADKGTLDNILLSYNTMKKMAEKAGKSGYIVYTSDKYSYMTNCNNFEKFILSAKKGNKGSSIIYRIDSDGGVIRDKYIYDGNDMYILSARSEFDGNSESSVTYISYSRIREWRYSDTGWFGYEVCVPEYPEVTEPVNGNYLIRVKPITKKKRIASEKYVYQIAYQGNNLLCSDWDVNHMKNIDYNGLYEYLYMMKYHRHFRLKKKAKGVPADKFEGLIGEYLPVSAEQIRKYAAFDKKNQVYNWIRLGCFNYVPDSFGTSFPEVTKIRKNVDGTMTLTVNAVCEMQSEEAVFTHEVTIKANKDGTFKYLGNKILNDGLKNVPEYQYRISGE